MKSAQTVSARGVPKVGWSTLVIFVILAGARSTARAAPAAPASRPTSQPTSTPQAKGLETVVRGLRVALDAPPNAYDQLISELRYEPLVDVQTRNLGEAQGDVSVRGGIFESTGFALGAATLFDPQTGHYVAEIPISPQMSGRPEVLTGVDNGLAGFNSTVATLRYGLSRIRSRSLIRLGVGTAEHHHQELYLGRRLRLGGEDVLGMDVGVAHSAAAGTVADGDHRFYRFSGRVQLQSSAGQTEVLVGYQRKFFGWRYLYALKSLHDAVGSSGAETETLSSLLVLANHRRDYARGHVEATLYYRRNVDDYELDRRQPGLFNPYEHETRVGALGLTGRHDWGVVALRYGAQATFDQLESTALTHGAFRSRSYLKGSLMLEREVQLGPLGLLLRGGAAADWSSRDDAALSPLGEIALGVDGRSPRWSLQGYVQYAEATQLAGYTALASNPRGGLFRGNADLRRERSRNLEVGLRAHLGRFRARAAFFHRWDEDLVDWVIGGTFQRSAKNIDLRTVGGELVLSWRIPRRLSLTFAQTVLHKLGDDELPTVDGAPASFYAFNFARYRATLALVVRPFSWLSFRADSELRLQADNALREGPSTALLSTAALTVHATAALSFAVAADNLFDSAFEEIPGVPASRRQILGTLQWRAR